MNRKHPRGFVQSIMRTYGTACYLCGARLHKGEWTVDRIDKAAGYAMDNCRPCCRSCASFKAAWPLDIVAVKCRRKIDHFSPRVRWAARDFARYQGYSDPRSEHMGRHLAWLCKELAHYEGMAARLEVLINSHGLPPDA